MVTESLNSNFSKFNESLLSDIMSNDCRIVKKTSIIFSLYLKPYFYNYFIHFYLCNFILVNLFNDSAAKTKRIIELEALLKEKEVTYI